ncbi:MAG: hypothetical protein PUC46_06485 [Lachnospiraceae bacterium]|nr:hypothetical protein [Lachnospiraceae bacterium]
MKYDRSEGFCDDIADSLVCYPPEQIRAAFKKTGFSKATKEYRPNKFWTAVLERKRYSSAARGISLTGKGASDYPEFTDSVI